MTLGKVSDIESERLLVQVFLAFQRVILESSSRVNLNTTYSIVLALCFAPSVIIRVDATHLLFWHIDCIILVTAK